MAAGYGGSEVERSAKQLMRRLPEQPSDGIIIRRSGVRVPEAPPKPKRLVGQRLTSLFLCQGCHLGVPLGLRHHTTAVPETLRHLLPARHFARVGLKFRRSPPKTTRGPLFPADEAS